MEELNDPSLNILKISLIAVSPLGQMTDEEFYKGVDLDAAASKKSIN